MLAIPLIRHDLVSDLVGRHIYLFAAGSFVADVLNRLAEAGALEGTVVLTEDEGARVAAAVLFRPDLPAGEVPVFSAIATLALSDAFEDEEVSVTPVWPDRLIVDGETVVRGIVEATSSVDHVRHVILGAEIDVPLPECGRRRAIDRNALIAKFLNALDRWVAAYAARGPAAVRAAIQFRPCGMSAASQATRGDGR
jgi:biotin-(acetyl-CoA carboxylase) ligase